MQSQSPPTRASFWRLLLLVPVCAVLWVPSFDSVGPALGPIPFFYWYQLLWVLLCSAVTGIVFACEALVRPGEDNA
jgi:hypothetical protein